jgi:prolyl oligopeptidase
MARSELATCRSFDEALRRALLLATLAAVGVTALASGQHFSVVAQTTDAPPKTPPTRTDNVTDVYHGVQVVDSYRWLEDQNAPETRAWIEAQNAYTDSLLAAIRGREQLKQRLTALLKIDSINLPRERNGRYFFTKRLASQDQPVLYMHKGLHGTDEVLIDPHPLSPDHTISVQLRSISRDGTVIVYSLRQGGEDETAPRLFDVDARKDLPDRLPKARYFSIALAPDKSAIYYSRMTPEGARVFMHKVGGDVAQDVEVFGKGYGPEKIIVSELSEDGRYLLVHVLYGSAGDRTEVHVQSLAERGPVVAIVNDLPARFFGTIASDQLFLHTNWKAPKGRILGVDLKAPSRDHWREVVPESNAVIENVDALGGRLGVLFTENASSRVKLVEPSGKLVREISLPRIGSVTGLTGRWSSHEAFYQFESFHIPQRIYRYDVVKGTQEMWAQVQAPIESDKYEVKQVWYASKDGTKVPMFLVYARGIKLDGSNPTLLTGYGGFNVSETPSYTTRAAAWISSGGIYALANMRGGGEFGEEWHRAGMLANKQNVFDDFIAAAEWLVKNNYTRPSRLAIRGASNGGLLVGAALTQRPDLFGAVVCGYPLLDMLRYHKFLVARWWVPEYGSSDDAEQFKFIYAYSPYQQVKPGGKYPAVLLISGDSDTRVDPLHARKMTARLQAATAFRQTILLHYDTKAGHSGGTPISKQVDDLTDELSFLFWRLGVSPAPANR